MKAIGILNYPAEDVFNIFIKHAKKDFSNFNEEDAKGCKIEKKINSGENQIECIVEITEYKKNEMYQITTSTNNSQCISTYNFIKQKDGTTKLVLEEDQTSGQFIGYMALWIQRFMARRNFKLKYNNIIDSLNNELKTYYNKERSKSQK